MCVCCNSFASRSKSTLHFSCFSVDGELWMAGWNAQGQLGVGHTQDLSLLQPISDLPSVTLVSCGWNHTLALTGNTVIIFINFNYNYFDYCQFSHLSANFQIFIVRNAGGDMLFSILYDTLCHHPFMVYSATTFLSCTIHDVFLYVLI